jgi:hypothetical protein
MLPGDLRDAHLLVYELAIEAHVPVGSMRLLKCMLRWIDASEFRATAQLICWPSSHEIAAETGFKRDGIIWARKALVASGILTRLEERCVFNGRDSVACYRINRYLVSDHAQRVAAVAHMKAKQKKRMGDNDADAQHGRHYGASHRRDGPDGIGHRHRPQAGRRQVPQ